MVTEASVSSYRPPRQENVSRQIQNILQQCQTLADLDTMFDSIKEKILSSDRISRQDTFDTATTYIRMVMERFVALIETVRTHLS